MSDVPLEALQRLVQRVTGRQMPLSAQPMTGGASTRRFFRVDLGDGRKAVAMFVPKRELPTK